MKVRALLPAAGFGTRMSMLPHQSKELLLDSTGKPIIEYALNLCSKFDLDPLVITRIEKQDLIHYCKDNDIEHYIIEPRGEWSHSLQAAYLKWKRTNILILPDTRFKPTSIIADIKNALDEHDIVFATHEVVDVSKWGQVRGNMVCEKPSKGGPGTAWGVIGFHRDAGLDLFRDFGVPSRWSYFLNKSLPLESFKDITRTGVISS